MTIFDTLVFDPVYEADENDLGDLLGFDLHGHHDPDTVDSWLQGLNLDEFGWDSPTPVGGFDARQVWRRKVPRHDFFVYAYQDHPGRGASPVTQLLLWNQWGFWCFQHPFEPATVGMPASQIIDGEQLVAGLVAAQDGLVEPRPVAALPRHHGPGYLYMCRDCGDDHSARIRAAQAAALANLSAQKEALA